VQVTPGYETTSLSVQGYGTLNIEDYLAGQSEIPTRACGTAQQAQENPLKFVVDNTSTPWDCWPEEAIKAQIVAFRSYAINYANTRGQICTTAACQVYNGSQNTRWAADETKGIVATYNGQVIEALYSSDNSQGTGTANNDTIFQNLAGDGNPIGYLRAVNDSAYARQTQWTNWTYSTNQYDFNSIDQMLSYAATSTSTGYSSSVKAEFQAIINDIGKVADINFERDPSLRVKKVIFIGSTGKQRTIGGWWFKNLWNSWIYDSGKSDYIYSQTFYLNR
jgi:SpoIID/LytB domain protein